MLWICKQCGDSLPITSDEFPVRCGCGAVDDGEEFKSAGIGDTIAKLTRRFGIRPCNGCKQRQAALNKWFPYRRQLSATRVDVLNCYPPIDNPEWITLRGDLYASELRKLGLSSDSVQVADASTKSAGQAISNSNPRVFVNHAFFFSWRVIAELAAAFPKTNFLTVNHSSQADLARHPRWLGDHSHFAELAQQRKNVFLGTVDSRNFLASCGLDRCLWVPNLVNWPRFPSSHHIKTDRPVASIVGRFDPNKAMPHAILAAAISGRVDLLFIVKNGRRDQLADYCQALRVSHEFANWSTWNEYCRTLFEKVTVGFQPSFSESFNYVSIEHLAMGIPVIGSPTIKFLPPAWQADPDDPRDIAKKLDAILDDYEHASKKAVRVAADVQRRNREQAKAIYQQLAK